MSALATDVRNDEKMFDVTIDIDHPVNFCAQLDRNLMQQLRRQYEGYCFKGVYIARILRVTNRSGCRVMSTNSSGRCTMDVQFVARVRQWGKWDIITGVRITSQTPLLIGVVGAVSEGDAPAAGAPEAGEAATAETVAAVVTLVPSPAVETLAVGHVVAVRVLMAQHPPMQRQASIVGTLLGCDRAAPVYRVRGALDASAAPELGPLLAAVQREIAARNELVRDRARCDRLLFFEELLGAYRPPTAVAATTTTAVATTIPGWPPTHPVTAPGARVESVTTLVETALSGTPVPVSGYWSRALELPRSAPQAAVADSNPPGWAQAVEASPRTVFAEFLHSILSYLVATRQMATGYTPDQITRQKAVWAALRLQQAAAPPATATPPAVAVATTAPAP